MLSFFSSHSVLVIIGLVFVAVLLLLEALHTIWKQYKSPEAKRLERRLRALSAADDRSNPTKLVKERTLSDMPRMQRVLQTMPRAHQQTVSLFNQAWNGRFRACCSAVQRCLR